MSREGSRHSISGRWPTIPRRFCRPGKNGGSRWRAFLARWREDFPNLSDSCKQAMAILEKTGAPCIEKPFRVAQLLKTVEMLVASRTS